MLPDNDLIKNLQITRLEAQDTSYISVLTLLNSGGLSTHCSLVWSNSKMRKLDKVFEYYFKKKSFTPVEVPSKF